MHANAHMTAHKHTHMHARMHARTQARTHACTHAYTQALLAAGLLQYLPFKPRTTGLLGVIASAMNCYMLLPAYPRAIKAHPKAQ